MLSGVICDLGHTLIVHAYGEDWARIRPRMIADLVACLQTQAGVAFDCEAFRSEFGRQFAEYDRQRRVQFVEYTAEQILRATFDSLNIPYPSTSQIHAAIEAFFKFSETLWQPAPGMHAVLGALRDRGLRLSLVSNAMDDDNVQRLIDGHNLRGYFDPIIVSAVAGIRKPNPRIFQPVVDAWAADPATLVVVGDTLGADVLGAMNAGMRSVWVRIHADRPDNREHARHLQPDVAIEALADLPTAIDRLNGGGPQLSAL